MCITHVRVQVPPRAPKRKTRRMSCLSFYFVVWRKVLPYDDCHYSGEVNSPRAKVFVKGKNAYSPQKHRFALWGPVFLWQPYGCSVPKKKSARMDAFLFRLSQIISVCRRKGKEHFPDLTCCVERSFVCSYIWRGKILLT